MGLQHPFWWMVFGAVVLPFCLAATALAPTVCLLLRRGVPKAALGALAGGVSAVLPALLGDPLLTALLLPPAVILGAALWTGPDIQRLAEPRHPTPPTPRAGGLSARRPHA